MDLKPIVLAALTAVEEEEVIGKVQVVGVVALASIRKYHRCIIIWKVPGAACDTP